MTSVYKAQRIWVVSELYFPEQGATGYYLTNVAEGLAQHHRVTVICGQPTYLSRGIKAPSNELRRGVLIYRVRSTRLNKDRLPFRIVNLITISVSIFLKALWGFHKDDEVLVVTNPPSLPFVVTIACKIRGAKCLLLIHDVYPDVLVAANVLHRRSPLTEMLLRLNRWLYLNVDTIIVLGRDMKSVVAAKLSRKVDHLVVIPHWADLHRVVPSGRSKNELLGRLGIQEKFVVQYSGNMGRTHGLECILNAAQSVQGNKDIHFLLIGSGAKRAWVENEVREGKLDNVSVLPFQSSEDLCISLNACDVALVSFVPGMAGISVPSRMYNILAAGKPIIAVCDEDSELGLVVREEKVGWVVPPDRPQELVRVLAEARYRSSTLQQMGIRARKAAEQKYSYSQAMKAYLRVFHHSDQQIQEIS